MKTSQRYTGVAFIIALFSVGFILMSARNISQPLAKVLDSTNGQRIERDLPKFTKLKLGSGMDAQLVKSNRHFIEIEADEDVIDNIVAEVRNGELYPHFKSRKGYYNKRNNGKVYLTIGVAELTDVSVSSAAKIASDDTFSTKTLYIDGSSAGKLKMHIDTERLNIDASSAANIIVEGNTGSLDADASSSGDIDASDVKAEEVSVDASSGGDIKVWAIESIRASASSGGDIYYKGQPRVNRINTSSGGDVHCWECK